jgi:Putative transposase/Transposase zinc-binding domain
VASAPARRARLADILEQHAPVSISANATRVVRDIVACRTPAQGGRVEVCDRCGDTRNVYRSCGNRHCPTCQTLEEVRWLQRQQADLLPVPYFHVVFTIPEVLHTLFLGARRQAYALLFAAAAETLIEVARENLRATPGILMILHTWSQVLGFHPHVHCIVTGGGLRDDHAAWVSTSESFLLPVRVLRPVFAGKLRQKLSLAAGQGQLRHSLAATRRLLWLSKKTTWRMYLKPPFGGPEHVLRYLGRYTHRIAISNERILDFQDGIVTFAYRDRKNGNLRKTMKLPADEFVRRFLLHILPKGFVRVRHYGILANSLKRRLVPLSRTLLGVDAVAAPAAPEPWQALVKRLIGIDPEHGTRCADGRYVTLLELPRDPLWLPTRIRPPP